MNKIAGFIIAFAVCQTIALAEEQVVSLDDEPHYSRIFSNEYCRAYVVSVGRLEQTKPVAHEHDWVRMTLGGTIEQASGGTAFGSPSYEDPEGYEVTFLFPVKRVALRNPRIEPYRALIVEIMQPDDSQNRLYDPSLDHIAQSVGPAVDPHASYVTTLTKTSVEIMNVQLLAGDSKDFKESGQGALLVAMTDLSLSLKQKDELKILEMSKGDVRWFSAKARTFTNSGRVPARFVLLDMN